MVWFLSILGVEKTLSIFLGIAFLSRTIPGILEDLLCSKMLRQSQLNTLWEVFQTMLPLVLHAFGCCFRYVLGAVETFLDAVPGAGIFRGNHWECWGEALTMMAMMIEKIWHQLYFFFHIFYGCHLFSFTNTDCLSIILWNTNHCHVAILTLSILLKWYCLDFLESNFNKALTLFSVFLLFFEIIMVCSADKKIIEVYTSE